MDLTLTFRFFGFFAIVLVASEASVTVSTATLAGAAGEKNLTELIDEFKSMEEKRRDSMELARELLEGAKNSYPEGYHYGAKYLDSMDLLDSHLIESRQLLDDMIIATSLESSKAYSALKDLRRLSRESRVLFYRTKWEVNNIGDDLTTQIQLLSVATAFGDSGVILDKIGLKLPKADMKLETFDYFHSVSKCLVPLASASYWQVKYVSNPKNDPNSTIEHSFANKAYDYSKKAAKLESLRDRLLKGNGEVKSRKKALGAVGAGISQAVLDEIKLELENHGISRH